MTLTETLTYKPVELSFGTSGLRGLVTDMTDLECYINTLGFLQFLQNTENLKPRTAVSLGGDLRESTPRIMKAVAQAITDSDLVVEYCGQLPTPALAYWAMYKNQPCVMVTGSHIPDDRNGIKFYKPDGEVLKSDETQIKAAVSKVRGTIYGADSSLFAADGSLKVTPALSDAISEPIALYLDRFLGAIESDALKGKHIVVYQHSAVGRDMLVELLKKLGANVTSVGRSDKFIPIDTENVTPEDQKYFHELAKQYPDVLAIVSTDGDSDRPFVIDQKGTFHRGDVLGFIVAKELGADFAAIPISSSDAVDESLNALGIAWQHTKIGSPHVIVAMQKSTTQGNEKPVGWEVNGGFLTSKDIPYQKGLFKKLPTRDAFLPILVSLCAALKQAVPVSRLFDELPKRFTQAGLIDNFAQDDSTRIISYLSAKDSAAHQVISDLFKEKDHFGEVMDINTTDGVRITFDNKEIVHIRPSGNAPQLRIYSVASSQERADEIVSFCLGVDGALRKLQALV